MTAAESNLCAILDELRDEYPEESPPKIRGVFEIVLYENVAYLVPDDRRRAVWADFCARIGTDPDEILATDPDLLAEVLQPGGMLPTRRAEKVLTSCCLAVDEFGGDTDAILSLPERARRKALRKFPGFGDPGVDKILLLTRTERVLALDSNGMRVLLRLGFGTESKNYATTYRSVQDAVRDQLPRRIDAVIRGHVLLRRHGQEVCKHSRPLCSQCRLADCCPSAKTG